MPRDEINGFLADDSGCAQAAAALVAAVAVPARNESERMTACLAALADQSVDERYAIVVLANNCTDDTAEVVRRFALSARVPIVLHDVTIERERAHAGYARRLVMNAAHELLGRDGVLMTTDADSRVSRNWIAANLAELRAGADLVCGLVSPDLSERASLPAHVYPQGALEYLYQRMAAELESLLDPLPHDPWPRHQIESGASLAVRADVYARVGGVPDVRPGEDRAFVARVRRAGGRVRHALEPRVATSCRLDGRARGGWADDLAERARNPKAPCHEIIEPAHAFVRRATLRGALRAAWPDVLANAWTEDVGAPEELIRELLAAGVSFEDAWPRIEAASAVLARRRIASKDLPAETARLKKALDRARSLASQKAKAHKPRSDFGASLWSGKLWSGKPERDARGRSSASSRKRRTLLASDSKG